MSKNTKNSRSSGGDKGPPLFLFWCREDSGSGRGGRLARDLGAVPFHAWRPGWDRGGTPAPVRYLFQALDTARALRRLRPSAVYVQVPPVFALVQAWWYGVRTGAPVAADNHSSFLDGKWRLFHWLQRPLARRIRLNLAHNEANLEMLRRWRGDTALLLKSPAVTRDELLAEPGDLGPLRAALDAPGAPRVFMVNRFAVDDAWREVFAAARLMPGARFFVTGDPAKAGLSPGDAPGNVVLTGFLSKPVFAALMDACDVTLSLTLRRDTLLWSIRESVALGKPFVTSDSPVIRAEFEGLGLFTDHSAESLRDRILEAVENRDLWAEAMAGYITRDRARWAGQIAEIRKRMG